MDPISFQRLEFPAVLAHLAEHAISQAARRRIRETVPWTEPETIRRHADAVSEILGLLDSGSALPIAGFTDCSEHLALLDRPNPFLESAQWLELRSAIRIAAALRRHVENARERMPVVWTLAENIAPAHEIEVRIGRVLDDDGLVRDDASAELRHIRNAMKRLEREVDAAFNRVLSRHKDDDILQEAYWTERNGRRVVPVRAGARGRLEGIVHDTSASGETLFMEPLDAIEPSNRLARETARERQEIYRILCALAAEAREHLPGLIANRDILVQIDLWHARARLAHRHSLHRPFLDPGAPLRLIAAHHPLIYLKNAAKSVPLGMELRPENRVLVITGPNTGGKTTALKTIGLLVLMAQSAIPIPAGVDSRLPVFRQVLAEIGDEQSVSEGLSTFSAHIRRISWILEHCAGGALVLLDELGKATDPLQAGALGRAILEALVQRDAITLVTTHLGTLKDWAHETPAGRNASYRLDAETHRPRYEMHMDTPGISEAFTIAEAEGLPHEIVEAATHALPDEERKMSELLQTLSRREAELEDARRQAQNVEREAEAERRRFEQQRLKFDETRLQLERDLEKRFEELLNQARRDIEQRIANLPSRQAISQAREQIIRDQESARQRMEALQRREKILLEKTGSAKEISPPKTQTPWQPAEGDWVTIVGGTQTGRIESLDPDRGRARIAIGGLQVDTKIKDLKQAAPPEDQDSARFATYRYLSSGPVESVRPELEIVGQRVEPAMNNVQTYLDRAILSHLDEVRIAHGYGTGALRNALHDLLRHHPHVRSFHLAERDQGGAAVTLVKLRD